MKTKMPKCMANAFFYRLKFKTIDLMTNYWVGGQPLTWWLAINLLAGQNIISNIRNWTDILHESCGNFSSISNKKNELIWISRTQDMGWTPNSVWATWQIQTSLLLLRFEVENDSFESWTLHEYFRSISQLSIKINYT
jgi:hypothetical protein